MIETVRVVHPQTQGNNTGYCVKNKGDLLPTDKIFQEPKKQPVRRTRQGKS